MASLSKSYNQIISEIEGKIKNPQELAFIKGKISELTLVFMDTIDRLVESSEKQERIEQTINQIQKSLKRIEEDIYINDDEEAGAYGEEFIGDQMHDNDENYEFEIVCPYCNYEFITGEETNQKDEISCPNCHNIIELDWEEHCDGECSHCKEHCYNEDDELEEMQISEQEKNDYKYTNESNKKNERKKKNTTSNKQEKKNEASPKQNTTNNENEDDM